MSDTNEKRSAHDEWESTDEAGFSLAKAEPSFNFTRQIFAGISGF